MLPDTFVIVGASKEYTPLPLPNPSPVVMTTPRKRPDDCGASLVAMTVSESHAELVLEVPPRREPELRSNTPSETVVKLNDAVILLVSDMGPFDPGPKGSSGLSIEKAPRTIGES